jgi:hypothetical protein
VTALTETDRGLRASNARGGLRLWEWVIALERLVIVAIVGALFAVSCSSKPEKLPEFSAACPPVVGMVVTSCVVDGRPVQTRSRAHAFLDPDPQPIGSAAAQNFLSDEPLIQFDEPGLSLKVMALDPVKKIVTNVPTCGINCPKGLSQFMNNGQAKAAALVARLRRDRPTWLHYILAVDVPVISGQFARPRALVRTGIFPNEAGAEVAQTICKAMRKPARLAMGLVQVFGVQWWDTGPDHDLALLAKCPEALG